MFNYRADKYFLRCEIDLGRETRSRRCERGDADFPIANINVQMRRRYWRPTAARLCEWRMHAGGSARDARGGLKRGSAEKGREGRGMGVGTRNLIYRRLRSVIGLWRVPVRHAVMHEQRPITRNVTIRPGDLCAYPRNYFALGPRVMNTGLNSRGPSAPANPPKLSEKLIPRVYSVCVFCARTMLPNLWPFAWDESVRAILPLHVADVWTTRRDVNQNWIGTYFK